MFSHWLVRLTGIATLSLAVCGAASAQYGGGGGTGGSGGTGATGGTGGYTPPSGGYSSGKAIGIGVGAAAGAAVGIALLVRHHHHHHAAENQTYSIVTNSRLLKAGERIRLKGVLVATDSPGNPTFHMRNVIKDYGVCATASASNSTAANTRYLN